MAEFLQKELGVAMSGAKWTVGPWLLMQSTQENVVLFTTRQPRLARSPENGRYQAAVSQFRQQKEDGSYAITGGSAIFTVTSATEFDAKAFEELKQQWIAEMTAIGPAPPPDVRFVALNTQNAEAQVLISEDSGTPDKAHLDKAVGTPGGTTSFLVDLTALGAQEWVGGIKERKGIPAGVKMTYEYLRMMPDVGAVVTVDFERAYTHLSGELNVTAKGVFYGGSAQIEAAYDRMQRNGTIKVEFIGTGLPADLEKQRQELVSTFLSQARENMFKTLFEPAPKVEPAQAGDTAGLTGGINFALKAKHQVDTTALTQEIRFKGWTWLKMSADADLTALLHELDESYLHEVNTELTFPSVLQADGDESIQSIAVSQTWSEGRAPEVSAFGPKGGTTQYVVASAHPQDVLVAYDAHVGFNRSDWPTLKTSGKATVGQGGNLIVIRPSAWVGRHKIMMFVRDGDELKLDAGPENFLMVNVSYEGPHLPRPIKSAARITPLELLDFTVPLAPDGRRGEAKFSAWGAVGGRLVRSSEVPINPNEEAVFILASKDDIQLVSQASMLPEDDGLAQDLLQAGGRPLVTMRRDGPAAEAEEPRTDGNVVAGTVVAIEYGIDGPVLVIKTAAGALRRVPVVDRQLAIADIFDGHRWQVKARLDDRGRARDLVVELPN
jgi:hypothetical protein